MECDEAYEDYLIKKDQEPKTHYEAALARIKFLEEENKDLRWRIYTNSDKPWNE